MNLTQIYSLVIDGVIFILVLYCTIVIMLHSVLCYTVHFILQHLVYSFIVHCHHFIEPWTCCYLLFQLLYWGCTLSCTGIEVKTLTQVSARADFLTVIHLVPLFFEEHLSLTADLIDMLLLTYQQVHSFIEIVTSVLSMFHVLVNVITDQKLNFQDDFQLYGFVIRVFYTEHELKILTSFLEESFSKITYAFYLLISSETLLQGFFKVSSNSSFCCSICFVASSICQKALCTYLHSDCNWSFCCYNGLTSSADSFSQSGSWSHFCLSECYSAQWHD